MSASLRDVPKMVGISWLGAAPQIDVRRSGLVVSTPDSGSDVPGSNLGVAHENFCVASLDKMFTHTVSQAHPAWPRHNWGVGHVPTNRALARCAR